MVNLKLNLRCFTQNYTGAVDYLNPLTRFQFNYIILYYIIYIGGAKGKQFLPFSFHHCLLRIQNYKIQMKVQKKKS